MFTRIRIQDQRDRQKLTGGLTGDEASMGWFKRNNNWDTDPSLEMLFATQRKNNLIGFLKWFGGIGTIIAIIALCITGRYGTEEVELIRVKGFTPHLHRVGTYNLEDSSIPGETFKVTDDHIEGNIRSSDLFHFLTADHYYCIRVYGIRSGYGSHMRNIIAAQEVDASTDVSRCPALLEHTGQ